MKKAGSRQNVSINVAEEIALHADGVGTIMWLLPDDLSKEIQALPARARKSRKEAAARRLSHIVLIALGLLKHPEMEHVHGDRVDRTLGELADSLSASIEHPPKPQ